MLVLTVPAIGFGATLVMLVYGFASEGFGIRQVERSFTVLDQVNHQASCWASRTVYAGLAPGRLHPASNTALCAPGIIAAALGQNDVSFEQFADGSIDGGLVPSRTMCVLPTATVATERARLRFKRTGADELEVLASDDLVPLAGASKVVVCDATGGCFVATADGTLRRVDAQTARSAVAQLGLELALAELAAPVPTASRYVVPQPPPMTPDKRFLEAVSRCSELRPGTYVAVVRRSPAFDDLGLEPDERTGMHLVVGHLAPEDVVE